MRRVNVLPDQRLNLLFLINSLGCGGAERSLAELLPFLLESGIRPRVVCLRRSEKGVEADVRLLACDIRVLSSSGLIPAAHALREIIRTGDVDLVHTTLFESDIIGRLAALGTGVPVLCSLVNTGYEPARLLGDPNVSRKKLWAVRMIDSVTARLWTSRFHAITEAVKDSAVRTMRISPRKITVIERGRSPDRLGVPSAERRQRARAQLSLSADDEVIVTVGRQEYQKGQRYLLEAVQALAPARRRLVLLVAGRPGHASDELRHRQEQSELGDRVRFLGHRDDVPDLLAAADVFAFPSLYEGLGGSVIEAMALALPVVASDLPALREVVEHGRSGLLVEPASVPSLTAALALLLDNRAMARSLGMRGRELFLERFTIARSAERMIELYREVASAV